MSEHEHEFVTAVVNDVAMCRIRDCTELRVATKTGLRELNPSERTEATIAMWEDLIILQALQGIHGKDAGMAKFLYLRNGGR